MRAPFPFLLVVALCLASSHAQAQIDDATTVTTFACDASTVMAADVATTDTATTDTATTDTATTDIEPTPSTRAEDDAVPSREAASWIDYPRNAAFEVNVLWPYFPGGIVVLRALIPMLFPDHGDFRGELIVGAYGDFAWRIVRDSEHHGRVGILAGLLGWRQFFVYGLHLEAMVMAGWRNEIENPYDGQPIDAFQGRLFVSAGYQHEFTRTFYVNLRGGFGLHLFRTDRFADHERVIVPTADLNFGFRW